MPKKNIAFWLSEWCEARALTKRLFITINHIIIMPKRKKQKIGPIDPKEYFGKDDIEIPVMKDPKWHIGCKNLTAKQKDLLTISLDPETNIIFIDGPAGSTKTYMAVYAALRMLSENDNLSLTYVRTLVETADKSMGALPGNVEEKVCPYMKPLMDKLDEMLHVNVKNSLTDSLRVEGEPVNFLRGQNWVDKIVIADESQNFDFSQLFTLITRLGEGSKLFVCGDSMQTDIKKSGFRNMVSIFDNYYAEERGIHYFQFNEDDIKRSPIQKFIVKSVNKYLQDVKNGAVKN